MSLIYEYIYIMASSKPSERWCKHGFLNTNERYNQNLHNYGVSIEERCAEYYSPEEIARMKDEIRVAECAICMASLTDKNDCRVCSDGHKFHNSCLSEYWEKNPSKRNICPVTNTIPTHLWQNCSSINDIHSGGRRRKTNNKRKSRKIKRSRKMRRSRK